MRAQEIFAALWGISACGGSPSPETTAQAHAELPPEPCSKQSLRDTMPIVACPEDGTSHRIIPLRSQKGDHLVDIKPGTAIVRLAAAEGVESIRRGPGHVDNLICVKTGDHSGEVAYVQNTMIFGGHCD
jgi:hypothetical protein